MLALKETGTRKALKFVLFGFLGIIYHRIVLHWFPFPPVRKLFLQLLGAKIGSDSILMEVKFFNWHHQGLKGLKIGKNCFIGDETLIDLYDQITLEDNVTIAQRVTILSHLNVGYSNHQLQKFFPKFSKPVTFKNGSVVAAASTVLPGITIGEESFVAAGSVVTKNVTSRTLVAGVPAKIIRKIK